MIKDLRFADYFLFTQHSLATFANCPLKFKKRYLEALKWDSFPDEKIKKSLEAGNDFHMLAHRYFMGMDTGADVTQEEFEELYGWVESLKRNFIIDPDAVYLPEYKLRMTSGNMKLEANFDLLIIKDDEVQIWDWKTHSNANNEKRVTTGKRLKESLQTMVYMFVLKEQLPLVIGEDAKCKKISMTYWQPEPEGTLAKITWSNKQHDRYRAILEQKVQDIFEFDYSSFEKERYSKHCKYCEFNWFCNNERVDLNSAFDDADSADAFDWDDVEEKF
jgi:hypothetical protein